MELARSFWSTNSIRAAALVPTDIFGGHTEQRPGLAGPAGQSRLPAWPADAGAGLTYRSQTLDVVVNEGNHRQAGRCTEA